VVRQIVYADLVEPLESLAAEGHPAGLVARLLTQDLPAVPRPVPETPPFSPPLATLSELLAAAESGRIAKEGIPTVLAVLAAGAPSVEVAIERAGLSGFSHEDLLALIRKVIEANAELVRTRGEAAFSPLMGDVMHEVRGRRDGREISETLRQEIDSFRGRAHPP